LTVTLFSKCRGPVTAAQTACVGSTTNVWTFVVLPTEAVATTFAQFNRVMVSDSVCVVDAGSIYRPIVAGAACQL